MKRWMWMFLRDVLRFEYFAFGVVFGVVAIVLAIVYRTPWMAAPGAVMVSVGTRAWLRKKLRDAP